MIEMSDVFQHHDFMLTNQVCFTLFLFNNPKNQHFDIRRNEEKLEESINILFLLSQQYQVFIYFWNNYRKTLLYYSKWLFR